MVSRRTAATINDRPLALRAMAAVLAALLVACFQLAPFANAYAANSRSDDTAETSSTKKALSTPGNNKSANKIEANEDEDEDEAGEEEDEEDRARSEAAEKRAEASTITSQAKKTQASFKAAKEEYDTAVAKLEDAKEQQAEAEDEYEEKSAEIDTLEESLAEYAVSMYKQGGAVPYLDVMLGATNYREFLVSWNMAVSVSQYGQQVVDEKRRIREEAEAKLEKCKKRVKQAEQTKDLADSKKRQTEATLLALIAQAARLNLEAAELDGTKREIRRAQENYENAQERFEKALASGLAGESTLRGTGYFTHPCPNSSVSSGFGFRSFDNAVHQGIDFAAEEGTPYYAAESGVVKAATNGGGYNGGAGNWIVIDHGNGVVTKYMHSLITFVSPGDRVVRGQNIGLVGSTGQSTGPHLHFQVEMNGIAVNPSNYL